VEKVETKGSTFLSMTCKQQMHCIFFNIGWNSCGSC